MTFHYINIFVTYFGQDHPASKIKNIIFAIWANRILFYFCKFFVRDPLKVIGFLSLRRVRMMMNRRKDFNKVGFKNPDFSIFDSSGHNAGQKTFLPN
jgi:hypothetical protein